MHLQVAILSKLQSFTGSRLFRIIYYLVLSILGFALLFWIFEKPYHEEGFGYFDAIESILIFTLSGFDVDPPFTIFGWFFAICSLFLGIFFVGAFTAEIASIFVEARLKRHSAVKRVFFHKHILVCGNLSDASYFFDQLFHPDHGQSSLQVVFLMPKEPNALIETLLCDPKYKRRVKYIIGSATNTQDLERANAAFAKAAFVFADRFAQNPDKEDAETILRTLSILSFNKEISTFVQILQSKNKNHIQAAGAEHFLCIDELSLNMIAQSCINPGLSQLIANLINTSDEEVTGNEEPAMQEYITGAGREIYRVPAGIGTFGQSFATVATAAFDEFGICVIGMQKLGLDEVYRFAVNPGHDWLVEAGDYLFVIADDFEEALSLSHKEEDISIPEHLEIDSHLPQKKGGWKGQKIPYEEACLENVDFSDHILICGSNKDLDLLIGPLRSPDLLDYQRIVLIHEQALDEKTLQTLQNLNEIYFLKGSALDHADLVRANIAGAAKVLILNDHERVEDAFMIDASTVMTVMSSRLLSPEAYIIAEIIYASNMRFVQEGQDLENMDKKAANEIVTMSRIADSMICQSFYTEGLLKTFEELFSVDVHDENEERNTCEVYQIPMPKDFAEKAYKELFYFLCYKHGIVSVGLYRQASPQKRYVFSNPPADTILRESDKIFVFAPDEPHF